MSERESQNLKYTYTLLANGKWIASRGRKVLDANDGWVDFSDMMYEEYPATILFDSESLARKAVDAEQDRIDGFIVVRRVTGAGEELAQLQKGE